MKLVITILYIIALVLNCRSQVPTTISGKYLKANKIYPELNESIVLKDGGRFEYFRKAAFTTFKIEGTWRVEDGYLLLNSVDSVLSTLDAKEKISNDVQAGKLVLKISYKDNTIPHCVVIINEGDKGSERRYDNVYDTLTISRRNVTSITVYSVLKHRTYLIKNCSTNQINIRISPNRVFDNEKWLIIGDEQIIPIGLTGEYVNYPLLKVH